MKAITIDALWAWAIIQGHKRVENRTWKTSHRGPLAIHAGLNTSRDSKALEFIRSQGIEPPTGDELNLLRGKVLGTVELVDCQQYHEHAPIFWPDGELLKDPWAFGPQCWLLDSVQVLAKPIPATGKQGLWDINF